MLIWPLLWEKNCFVAATKAFWNYKSIFNGPIEYAYAYRRIYALFTCKHIRVHMYFNMLTRNDIDIVKVPSITPTISMGAVLSFIVEITNFCQYQGWKTLKCSLFRRNIKLFLVKISNFWPFKEEKLKNLCAFGAVLLFIVQVINLCQF